MTTTAQGADQALAAGSSAGPSSRRVHRIATSGPDTLRIPVPGLGEIELSRPELVYVAGVLALSAFGLLEWPIAVVIAGGHVLAADRGSKTVRDLGAAMEEV